MDISIEQQILQLLQDTIIELYPRTVLIDYLDLPKDSKYGDYSTNAALRLAKIKKTSPQKIGENITRVLISKIENREELRRQITEVKLISGFINFFLTPIVFYGILSAINAQRENYGRLSYGTGKSVNIEFVSANPTGPLSVAHGRQAAVGDILANVLEFSGYTVTREYYLNDEGNQIKLLGESVYVRYLELFGKSYAFPVNGYCGRYIIELAQQIQNEYGEKFLQISKDEAISFFSDYAMQRILDDIKQDLILFGVKFDQWSSQKEIGQSGRVEETINILKKTNFVYKKDGAAWLKSSEFGDDKDRVLVKQDGAYTYITPDIAYHQKKYSLKYDLMVNIWGPDHHGYIPRIKAAMQALGFDKEKLRILIIQLTTLYRQGEIIPMSTRAGEYVTLREVRDEAGRDAARFFFVMRKCNSHLDFDLALAKQKSLDNPVYYIQYAHARICSISEFKTDTGHMKEQADLTKLDKPEEIEMIKQLAKFPKIISECVHNLEPYALTLYLRETAGLFHAYYNKYRVVTDDAALTLARRYLIDCVRQVVSNGLTILGIEPMRRM